MAILRRCFGSQRIQLARRRIGFYLCIPSRFIKLCKPAAKLGQFMRRQLLYGLFYRLYGGHQSLQNVKIDVWFIELLNLNSEMF